MYDAISWLQDTGVLQKMDDDVWRIHGKFKDIMAAQKVGIRPIAVGDILAGFLLLLSGLFLSLIAFTFELTWMRNQRLIQRIRL